MQYQAAKDKSFKLMQFLRNNGIRLEHGKCLEAVARVFYDKPDWNTLVASFEEKFAEPTEAHKALMKAAIEAQEPEWRAWLARNKESSLSVYAVAIGDAQGKLLGYGDGQETQALFNALCRMPDVEDCLIVSASVLLDEAGALGYGRLRTYEVEAELNRTVTLKRWYNNAAIRGNCPLTGEDFKPFIGLQYFLEDTASPVSSEVVPGRLDAFYAGDFDDPTRAPTRTFVVTVSEFRSVVQSSETSREGHFYREWSAQPLTGENAQPLAKDEDTDAPF